MSDEQSTGHESLRDKKRRLYQAVQEISDDDLFDASMPMTEQQERDLFAAIGVGPDELARIRAATIDARAHVAESAPPLDDGTTTGAARVLPPATGKRRRWQRSKGGATD